MTTTLAVTHDPSGTVFPTLIAETGDRADAGIETPTGCRTFRATGTADYLTNGGRTEVARRMAGHWHARTTRLYDRRNDDVSMGEAERIGI
jgi:integrase